MAPCDCTTKNLSGKAEPVAERHPQNNPSGKLTKEVLVPSDWTTKKVSVEYAKCPSLRAVADRVAIQSMLVLRLAFSCSPRGKRAYVLSALRTPLAHANATARACAKERAGKAGLITLRQNLPTYRGSASGTPRRALDSTQGKPCSVALLGLAFTMAEILLSLTIIGVVAAITLPSLTGNINERTWNTQRKALYARFSQAIALMPALNGYGTLTEGDSSTSAEDTAAETFVTAGLSKVLKINNICDSEHLEDCGIVSQITNLQASKVDVPTTLVGLNPMFNSTFIGGPTGSESYQYSQLDTKAAAFETANGESIIVYYNPNCISDLAETTWNYRQAKMCANFIYDLNGNKGPNTFGKDIGVITVLYPSDSSVVAPVPVSVGSAGSTSQKNAGKLCQAQDSESRVPNRDELAAIFYNRVMFGLPGSGYFWTSSVIDSSNGWGQSFYTGRAATLPRTGGYNVWCVKR